MQVACVVDGKGFEISGADHAHAVANTEAGAVPALVCSVLCAEEYEINLLDWPQARREAEGVRAY